MPKLSNLSKTKNWKIVLEYAESIRDGRKIACEELQQAIERFFRDLENPEYDLDPKAPEFCIGIIEKTLCHQQGEKLGGIPLRGTPFLLEPFHKFIIYNLSPLRLRGRCRCGIGGAEAKPILPPLRSCRHWKASTSWTTTSSAWERIKRMVAMSM